MQEILAAKALDSLDKACAKHHQKLLILEALPANVWYLAATLRTALVDARVMHAALPNTSQQRIVDLFNGPQSIFRVLIMLYDVGAVGLNLHKACNRCLILSLARTYNQEEQGSRRLERVRGAAPTPRSPRSLFEITLESKLTRRSSRPPRSSLLM